MPGLLDLIAARNPEQAGGLLSDLVAAPRNRLRGLLDNPIGFANDALQEGLFGPPEVRAARDKFWNKEPMTDLEKQAYTNQLLNMGMAGLTVYHGSPHKFDKFDMSKIGTGEGAQAYGHGLYFAESPRVAESYRRALSDATVDGKVANWSNANDVAAGWFDAFKDRKKAADYLRGQLKNTKVHSADDLQTFKQAIDVLESGKQIGEMKPGGQLYKVDLPDEAVAKMLDWDKPLSQQAPEVQKLLEPLGYSSKAQVAAHDDALMAALLGDGQTTLPKIKDPMGSDIARGTGLFDGPAQVEKAKRLRELGIPGIRYLDGGSRNAGQGTYNYVVFDDTLPTILERNGQKLK